MGELTERERWLMVEAFLAGLSAKKPHTSPHSAAMNWLDGHGAALSKDADYYTREKE